MQVQKKYLISNAELVNSLLGIFGDAVQETEVCIVERKQDDGSYFKGIEVVIHQEVDL
ncbi:hypothetical protein QJV44_gp52 [Serratia phage vB_SmaS_Tlacuache]|uniref:Uncharacterized protein n=1 Tax=Serratia phage vB_SmaS_Tlacuache TaxID=2894809 RepID=A0AAE9CEV4_9CAUD|nr:hypothetical protein QJV44_gp52 [Serratia phage vB_SmaS_Tlacuache]UGO51466.1 hypothetical protein TLACUACHE_52 [Serratia phage vB_SmaS_Tlacuache]